MTEKTEIKSYSTAFLMSLAIHALVLVLIIIFSQASLNAHKMVVIDLTLMDPVTAGVAGAGADYKKSSAVPVPKTKNLKAVVEDVEPVMVQKKQELEEKKAETEEKVPQEDKTPQVDEQIPAVKTVSLVQDTKQNFISEDQVKSKRAGTVLSTTREIAGQSSGEQGGPGIYKIQDAGNGADNAHGAMKGYLNSHLSYIKDLIQKNISYPDNARRNGWMGKVTVSFIIAHNGCVRDIEVMRSSGFDCLDKNAVKAVKRSSPFPHPPLEARIIIPILYELH